MFLAATCFNLIFRFYLVYPTMNKSAKHSISAKINLGAGAQLFLGKEWNWMEICIKKKGGRWHLYFWMVRGLIESSSNGNGKLEDVAIKMLFPRSWLHGFHLSLQDAWSCIIVVSRWVFHHSKHLSRYFMGWKDVKTPQFCWQVTKLASSLYTFWWIRRVAEMISLGCLYLTTKQKCRGWNRVFGVCLYSLLIVKILNVCAKIC